MPRTWQKTEAQFLLISRHQALELASERIEDGSIHRLFQEWIGQNNENGKMEELYATTMIYLTGKQLPNYCVTIQVFQNRCHLTANATRDLKRLNA